MTDEQLLDAFVSRQDARAFEELVRRHGPMVLRVCQRVLHHVQDAEDAFQATFVVLARKASAIAKGSTASWLYGVAYRIALQTRERRGKHASAESLDERTAPAVPDHNRTGDHEGRQVIDEELNRLPEKYRAPLVLCYLEGRTNQEAARQLGCTEGVVQGMLARGRERLRARLARRGMAITGAALATTLLGHAATAAVSPALASGTAQAAMVFATGKSASAGLLSTQAGALADAAIKAMFWGKMKAGAALLGAVVAVAVPVCLFLPTSPAALVGHYSFTEGQGTRVGDASPSGNHGNLVGNVTWTAGPRPGTKALSFDGRTGYVQLDQNVAGSLGGTASVAFWIKTTQTGNESSAFAPSVVGVNSIVDNDMVWGWLDDTGRICVIPGKATSAAQSAAAKSKQPINDALWHHVALTRDVTTGKLEAYVDGTLANSAMGLLGLRPAPLDTIGWNRGARGGGFFKGQLADVRFYARVLSAEEIRTLAQP